jgi:hypothetical protein
MCKITKRNVTSLPNQFIALHVPNKNSSVRREKPLLLSSATFSAKKNGGLVFFHLVAAILFLPFVSSKDGTDKKSFEGRSKCLLNIAFTPELQLLLV